MRGRRAFIVVNAHSDEVLTMSRRRRLRMTYRTLRFYGLTRQQARNIALGFTNAGQVEFR